MATVTEKTGSRKYENNGGKRKHTRLFLVVFDAPSNGDDAATEVGEIPFVSTYGSSVLCVCKSLASDCVDDKGEVWEVTVEYDNDFGETSENPLNQPWQVGWDHAQYTEITHRDINGNAVRNSAQMPFQDGQEIDNPRPILTITRNQSSYNQGLAYSYRRAVNSDVFYGCAPGTVKVVTIKGDLQYDQNYGNYWTVNYQFEFNMDGYDRKILDAGVMEIKNNKLVPILKGGEPVSDPVCLDGQGKALPVGGQPVFRTYQFYNYLPFSVFNL